MAAFPGQDVVGPAGSLGAHGFQADAPRHEGPQPRRRREPVALAAPEDDHFGVELREQREMLGGQVLEAVALPFPPLTPGADHHAAGELFPIDRDPVRAVGADGLGFGAVGLEFHGEGRLRECIVGRHGTRRSGAGVHRGTVVKL